MSFGSRWRGWSASAETASSPREKLTNDERFWAKVQKQASGCWEWQGALDNYGYGVFNRLNEETGEYKVAKAHRYSLELKLGRPLEPGMQGNHECDNRKCVNPNHLYEGDQVENMRDAIERNRLGHDNEKKEEALRLRGEGMTQREVADVVGVSPSTVSSWERRANGE